MPILWTDIIGSSKGGGGVTPAASRASSTETFRADGPDLVFMTRSAADGSMRLVLPSQITAELARQCDQVIASTRRRQARERHMSVAVTTVARPYNVFTDGGLSWQVPSHVAQELINAASAIIRATAGRVVLQDGPVRMVIVPATLGGGVAFVITKARK